MNDSVLAKFANRGDDSSASNDNPDTDDFGVFGFLRGVRDRSIMLELHHRNGSISALAYAWLERAEFDPSDGIKLHFSGRTVTITGRNLNAEIRPNVRLFAAIARHRVPWIQESDERTILESKQDQLVIERLAVNV